MSYERLLRMGREAVGEIRVKGDFVLLKGGSQHVRKIQRREGE